jgi:hypothetical protein
MPTVTLVLATGPGFPGGSEDHRYELDAALDSNGYLDAAAWHADPRSWAARRYRPGETPRGGDVQQDAETGWSLRFDSTPECRELSEPLLNAGVLRPGEYVTVRDEDGRDYSYRVVSVA